MRTESWGSHTYVIGETQRNKPTPSEIKRGGGKFSVRTDRHSKKWKKELKRLRKDEND